MKFTLFAIILMASSAAFAQNNKMYPDSKLTPGKINETVTKEQLCTVGYTKDVRLVTQATKDKVFARYGLVKGEFTPGDYEIDHFISLELGGLNDIENLWPQPYCPAGNKSLITGCYGAREKDRVETNLHKRICSDEITMKQAQDIIKTDWIAEYKSILEKMKK